MYVKPRDGVEQVVEVFASGHAVMSSVEYYAIEMNSVNDYNYLNRAKIPYRFK